MTMPYGLNAAALALEGRVGALHIRPLAWGDETEWRRLWGLYLDFYETTISEAQYGLSWERLFDDAEPMFGYLAARDGSACGLVHIVFHRSFWLNGPSCYLQDLYADVALRGTGIGRALIEHVYRVAEAAGVKRVHWLTHSSNATAQRLYDRVAENSGFMQYRKAL